MIKMNLLRHCVLIRVNMAWFYFIPAVKQTFYSFLTKRDQICRKQASFVSSPCIIILKDFYFTSSDMSKTFPFA